MTAWMHLASYRRALSRVAHHHRSCEATILPLASTLVGHGRDKPLLILHGLFGSKRNWKGLSKAFCRALGERPIYSIDLRNHGTSPHARPHTYEAMAADVANFISDKGLTNVSILGHSMGAKVAMSVALSLVEAGNSQVLSDLIVVDMPPAQVTIGRQMRDYIGAMESLNAMPPGMIKTLADADRFLAPFEPNVSNRELLLTNLCLPSHLRVAHTHHGKAKFSLPLDILGPSVNNMEEFPWDHRSGNHPVWPGRTLVIAGNQSEYRVPEYSDAFKAFFPNYQLRTLDAGHWVQAERPAEFLKLSIDFLNRKDSTPASSHGTI